MSTPLLKALTAHSKLLVLALVFATILTGCGDDTPVVGNVSLKGGDEMPLSFRLPSKDTRWRLRFGLLPWDQINSLKATDRITVYLENNDSEPVVFSPDLDHPRINISPGEKIQIFGGTLSDLLMCGRGSMETMAFAESGRRPDLKLYFVPHLEEKEAYTMRVSLFYDHYEL